MVKQHKLQTELSIAVTLTHRKTIVFLISDNHSGFTETNFRAGRDVGYLNI